MPIAENEYKTIIKRLKTAIVNSGYSLRGICTNTQNLGPHEQLYHSNMSEILRHTGRYNLSLQQFIMLSKLLGTTPKSFFDGTKKAKIVASAFDKLETYEQEAVTGLLIDFLNNKPRINRAIVQRLSSSIDQKAS